ncbi:MAG: D-aminoacyl-tRNA deacylase [Cyanobacteria bacterium P01_C01_bin.120]
MRVLIQRVTHSQVSVQDKVIGKIGRGLTLLVGITATDTAAELDWMAQKCLNLRLFTPASEQAQNQAASQRREASVQEIGGEILVVSQFTLYGDCRKGRRPSFVQAAPAEQAAPLFEQFVEKLRASGLRVQTGKFGADMQVEICNDGPVTLWLEREAPM